jgi:hypothetical protein
MNTIQNRIRICQIILTGSLVIALPACNQVAIETTAGHPDLSGVWADEPLIFPSKTDGESVCVFDCDDFEGVQTQKMVRWTLERPLYKPELQALVDDLHERQVDEDSVLRCMPPGVPRIGPPDEIVQGKNQVVFLYEDPVGFLFRSVPVDGSRHRENYDPSYLGDPIGWWEDDTLVVETVNFNTDTWLVDDGAYHSEKLRVVEKFRREGDNLIYDVTAYDEEILAEPWVKETRTLTPMGEPLYEPLRCVDDMHYQMDKSHHDNPR